MPEVTPYVTAEMLRAALSPATYYALLDDDQVGIPEEVDASAAVALVLKRGHARVLARLPTIFVSLPDAAIPADVPALLQDAELLYCECLSYERHPEYVRQYGGPKGKLREADEIMERIQAAILQIADNPPQPSPANVGGIVTDSGQRTFLGYKGGVLASGDF